MSLKEIRQISLDILKDVAAFCDENRITYYLACGTLLGAVKYQGFIPWDDDIDIMMPRPEYNRFIESYESERYRVLKPSSGMFFYAKVYDRVTLEEEIGIDYKKYRPIGVNIDVFPLDGIIDDEKTVERKRKTSNILEMLLRLSNQPIFYRKNKLKAINRIIPRIIGSKNLVRMIERNASQYDYDKSDFVIRYKNTSNGFTGALSKKIYEKTIDLSFEGYRFHVPSGYDEWLKRFYGNDYMITTPSQEERKTHQKNCYRL
ncbi:MAG: LicD family protein [Erysipelotrichaceae bacterium]|nr:LicD family protein [Erysipelotrichaceae bacterium]